MSWYAVVCGVLAVLAGVFLYLNGFQDGVRYELLRQLDEQRLTKSQLLRWLAGDRND